MHKLYILLALLTMFWSRPFIYAQSKSDRFLLTIFASNKNQLFHEVLQDAKTYRCQVIYTQINRDKNNLPHFKNYYFNYDSLLYFNPASTVKMPLAFLSLEKLHA